MLHTHPGLFQSEPQLLGLQLMNQGVLTETPYWVLMPGPLHLERYAPLNIVCLDLSS